MRSDRSTTRMKAGLLCTVFSAALTALTHGEPAGLGAAAAEAAKHRHHLGRRHRPVRHQRLFARPDGLQDAQYRPHRQRRHDVHRLLRGAELHRRPRLVHHRPVRPSHRHDQGGPAGRHARAAEGRPDHCRAAQAARLCDRTVRQEPSRRPQRVPADRARLRRVLRQPLSPQRRGRAGAAGLSERPRIPREIRPARRDGLQGLGQGRSDRRSALRQGRQAGLHRHRSADQGAHGRRSTTTSPTAPSTSSSGRTGPANPPSCG